MSSAYSKTVHVTEHFHMIKLFNRKLTKLRYELYDKVKDVVKKASKESWLILLKNSENLMTINNETQCLNDALKLNESLSIAYYLKNEL